MISSEKESVRRRLAIKRRLPFLIHPIRWARYIRAHFRYPRTAWRLERASAGRVIRGPFKGLLFPAGQTQGFPELLGVYEEALVPVIEGVIASAPDIIVDVGAAYGYYALGLAMRMPASRVVAYEIDNTRLSLLRKYRSLNNLEDRVELRGECTGLSLAADLGGEKSTFVLVDIEGGEAHLLDPQRVPALRGAEFLVELHEMFVPRITELLRDRFDASHHQTIISAVEPKLDDLDLESLGLHGCNRDELAAMLDEGRELRMQWLHLMPKG